MNLKRFLIHAFFQVPYLARKATRTGPFGRRAPRIAGPLRDGAPPLQAALVRHHVKQYHEASCSVATVAAVTGALREVQTGGATPIGQLELLETVATANWKKRMSPGGDRGKRGLPLPLLGEVVIGSLAAYAIRYRTVEVVQARKAPAQAGPIKALLSKRLTAFATRGDCLIIAHFNQGVYVPTYHIPHISPVGGFDAATGQVTVLDVDPEQEQAYQVDFETFYRGLASDYGHLLKPFGFGSGGYVFIDLGPPGRRSQGA